MQHTPMEHTPMEHRQWSTDDGAPTMEHRLQPVMDHRPPRANPASTIREV
ncbi:MAG TPA: hypothetical protein VL284_13225 [Thermoanaerobaculia bacterium]|nr:hypothetical protein [Thermoanaerobaculia bacterium]